MSDVALPSLDAYGVEAFAGGPPHGLFDRDRELAPVRRIETVTDRGLWSVTTYARAKEMIQAPGH